MALLAPGCGPVGDLTPLPSQAQAVDIVWRQVYKDQRSPPPIYWRRDHCGAESVAPLTCTFDGVLGLEQDNAAWIEIGAPSDPHGKISMTALAHELLHADQNNRGFDDPDHQSPEWFINGGKAGVAFQALLDAGL